MKHRGSRKALSRSFLKMKGIMFDDRKYWTIRRSRLALRFGLCSVMVAGIVAIWPGEGIGEPGQNKGVRFHTRSIAACDPASGQCGIAVVSFPAGVHTVVPVGEPGVIVANQAFPSIATARAIIAN